MSCEYCSKEGSHYEHSRTYDGRRVETYFEKISDGLVLSKYETFMGEKLDSRSYYINFMTGRIGEYDSELICYCPICGERLPSVQGVK